MTVSKSLWRRRYPHPFSASFPCPRCKDGMVRIGSNSMTVVEPEHSKRHHADDNFEPDWISSAFTGMLICDNTQCGEVVAVSGTTSEEMAYDEDDYGLPIGQHWETVYHPASMYPAPPLFTLAEQFPDTVKAELKLAFQLFWADLSASTSRLRTSLERVLDDRGIPAFKPGKKGKQVRLFLNERIDMFEQSTSDPDSAESMEALRVVGNLGTHGDQVKLDDYLNLLDVYEDALTEIYTQKKVAMKNKKLALIALGKK